ncbi:hypothetical protein HFO56_00310 [Rhizobium laguerreae]|uniref:hypothetical protein n=1 Tax=Rhizobium laguerreae TaxID=1076926 RepID=UPI001C91D153|nr:hypothetical protein [Rhizobium laguerreae]MBY3150871.1 hypothetical protein [Rhizobium laguerreae]
MSLSDAERRLMEEIPPQHLVSACPFQWAAERAGFDWETGKKMLQTFLDRKLIWDLNNDTLDDPLGICDRTRFGDLEMGVYISVPRWKTEPIVLIVRQPHTNAVQGSAMAGRSTPKAATRPSKPRSGD